jgi:hypothetical protein
MVSSSNQMLRPIDIEDNVTIPIPNVDKGRGDPRNILCIVTHFCSDTKRYKLGILHGTSKSQHFREANSCRPLFMVCPNPTYTGIRARL